VTERLRRIATRMRQELAAIERLAVRAARAMELARQRSTEQDFYLDSVALSLHDIYTGLERVFQQVATGVDEDVPSGEAWHEALLRQMAVERPPRRPAVITEATRDALDNFLRFRHVVRNVYAFEFDGQRLGRLVEDLGEVLAGARTDLLAFAEFLERLASGEER
jgi:hypothetical protein